MTFFYYQARTSTRELIDGKVEAESLEAAIRSVIRLGHSPLKIAPVRLKHFTASIKSAEVALWTRQLSDLLFAGVPLLHSLKLLAAQTRNPSLQKKIEAIHDGVKQGRSFSSALGSGDCFPSFYAAMVKAGEVGNHLAATLNQLAEFLERGAAFRSQVRMSLIYPLLILSVGLLAIVVLLVFVLPGLTDLLEEFNAALPWPTVFLIRLSAFLRRYGWLVIPLLVSLAVGIYRFPPLFLKQGWQRWQLNIPYLGKFIRNVEVARFTRTLAALLENGAVISESLRLAAAILENQIIKAEFETVSQKVREGKSLSLVLRECSFFPSRMISIIMVHEQSGHLEQGFLKAAEILEKETVKSMKLAATLLEPMLILGVGLVIGFIVLALLWPVFQLNLMVG